MVQTYTVGGKTYTKEELIANLKKQQAAIKAEKAEPVTAPAKEESNVFNQPAYTKTYLDPIESQGQYKAPVTTGVSGLSGYSAEWQEKAKQGLSVGWITKNVNPLTGKLFSEEARAAQVAEQAKTPDIRVNPVTGNQETLQGGQWVAEEKPVSKVGTSVSKDAGTVVKDKAAPVVDTTAQEEQERQDAADNVNKLAQDIFAGIKEDDVDVRESVKILADLKTKIEEGLGEDGTEEPESLADLFKAEKEKLGLDVLETELADLDSEIEAIQANLLIEAEKAGEKVISSREIGRAKGAIQKRADREIALLQIERNAVARQMNNKMTTLETIMSLSQADISNSSAYYNQQLDRNIQLYNLISGAEEDVENRQAVVRSEAKANLTTLTNLFKSLNVSYMELTEANKQDIRKLELEAGLPVGITEAFMSAKPDAEVLSTVTGYNEAGEQIITYVYKGDDGKPGVVEVVKTGGVKESGGTTGNGDGTIVGGGTIVDDGQGGSIDLSTSGGMEWAKNQGHTYEDVYNFLDKNTDWSAGVISDKLKRAGFQTIEEETKAQEREYSNREILDFAEMYIRGGESYNEFVGGLEGASDADKAETKKLWDIKKDELEAVGKSETILNKARRAIDKALERVGPEEAEAAGKTGVSEEPQARKGIMYKIKPGDTLGEIASKYGISVKELVEINNITDPNKIYAGKTLKIPVSGGPIDI